MVEGAGTRDTEIHEQSFACEMVSSLLSFPPFVYDTGSRILNPSHSCVRELTDSSLHFGRSAVPSCCGWPSDIFLVLLPVSVPSSLFSSCLFIGVVLRRTYVFFS